MKKIVLCIAFIIAGWVIFQSCSEDTQTKMKGHTPDSEVPLPVKSAFSTKYPGASDVEWNKAPEVVKHVYLVKFKFENKEREIIYDETGNPVKSKND